MDKSRNFHKNFGFLDDLGRGKRGYSPPPPRKGGGLESGGRLNAPDWKRVYGEMRTLIERFANSN